MSDFLIPTVSQEVFDKILQRSCIQILKIFAEKRQAITEDDNYNYKKYISQNSEVHKVCRYCDVRKNPDYIQLNDLLTNFNKEAKKGKQEALDAITYGATELRKRLALLYGQEKADKIFQGRLQ